MIDLRIDGKIPLLNDYGSAFFEKGVLLFSLISFGESYRSSSAGLESYAGHFHYGYLSVSASLPGELPSRSDHVDSSFSLSG